MSVNNEYIGKRIRILRNESQIIVKITADDPNNTLEFIEASYRISKLFRKCRFSHDEIAKQEEYLEYKRKYLEK